MHLVNSLGAGPYCDKYHNLMQWRKWYDSIIFVWQ